MPSHKTHPEIWLRVSPGISEKDLLELTETKRLRATPRLGMRGLDHEKGYVLGQVVELRVFDAKEEERLSLPVRIGRILIKRLCALTRQDLKQTHLYSRWTDVQRDLSFFEKRQVEAGETVSIVEFSYL